MSPSRRHTSTCAAAIAGALVLGLATSGSTASAATSSVLRTAQAVDQAERALVSSAQAAAACPSGCDAQQSALQQAGSASAASHRLLARAVKADAAAARTSTVPAPVLRVSGRRLTWTALRGVRSYVLVRAVAGQTPSYSLVRRTRVSPPAVPGARVRYAVRASAPAARWSGVKTVVYAALPAAAPAPTTTPGTAVATTAASATTTASATTASATTTATATPIPVAAPATPAATPAVATSAPTTAGTGRPVDAPSLTVDAGRLAWNQVAAVADYVVVRKAAGLSDQYSVVRGTSWTPQPLPGKRVTFSVRTAVAGSAWAREQSCTYPADAGVPAPTTSTTSTVPTTPTTSTTAPSTTTPVAASPPATTPPAEPVAAPAPAPSSAPAPATSSAPGSDDSAFVFGINSGSAPAWELSFIRPLGARHVRIEFDIDSTPAEMAPVIDSYARAGVQVLPLAGFNARIPSPEEARNVATWAATYGRGGTFWAGKAYPASVQVADIEFGNETNNPWQYNGMVSYGDDWFRDPAFLQRAADYARRVRDAGIAVAAANPQVGVLAVGDQYGGHTTWVESMFAAVPDLSTYVAGWTVHPYGPNWRTPMDTMLARIHSYGGPDRPLYATEWGLSTDGGHCLSDNYGWNRCMGSGEAAVTLQAAVLGMRARYGTRLAAIYLYATIDQRPSGADADREHFFGAVRSDGSAKGAYTDAVRSLLGAGA